jgi:DNA-binding Lrp family transcriptional regulator
MGDELSPVERRLLLEIQDGLPIVERPYAAVAQQLNVNEADVIAMLASLLNRGVIKRLGAVPNHYVLGITANGMAVWDVLDEAVDAAGWKLATRKAVTHCYRRPRHPPDWPYNLYVMVHGRSRAEVESIVAEIAAEAGLGGLPHELLFSRRQFRKRGTRISGELSSN